MKKYVSTICLASLLIMYGCNDFLDVNPDRSQNIPITHCDQLDALMGSFEDYFVCSNYTTIYGTDDADISVDMYDRIPGRWNMDVLAYALWDIDYLSRLKAETTWRTEYSKIFAANVVFQYVDDVPGTPEQKERLKGEAHLMRAYSMMEIANVHSLPYNEKTKDEPGLALKRRTSFDETDTRATLEQTHKMIEDDLNEALRLRNNIVAGNRVRHWRASNAAANAIAARYWLNRNEYEKALVHADRALSLYSDLIDYNTEMRYSAGSAITVTHYPDNPDEGVDFTIQFPYTYDSERDYTYMLGWKEFYYFRLLYNNKNWFPPSAELVSTYDRNNDLRYKYHMIEGYSYTSPADAYEYPSFFWWGYVNFSQSYHVQGPTTAEMILTKAECLARSGRIEDALQTVNILRKKRISNQADQNDINLTAASRREAIEKILAERRREMPMAMRWFDARRLNDNEDAFDDIEFSKEFYSYEAGTVLSNDAPKRYYLNKDSRRWAMPIPLDDIISSNGNIQQNQY